MQQKFMQKKNNAYFIILYILRGKRESERKREGDREERERNRDKTVSIPKNNCAPLIA